MVDITINGRFLTRTPTGVERFATEILRCFDQWVTQQDDAVAGLNFEIHVPMGRDLSWAPRAIPVVTYGRLSGQAWEQFSFPRRASGVVVSLCNVAPLFTKRQIVAIHDATPVRVPATFSWAFRTWYRAILPIVGAAAARVVSVSEFSRREVAQCYGIDLKKITVIGNGADHVTRWEPDDSILAEHALSRGRYVLAVGSSAPHKNLEVVFRAAASSRSFPGPLVVVGPRNERVFAAQEVDGQMVRHLGYVSDSQLMALYQNALCFVFPSLYEGFGIPPLEAMMCGCPVVSSGAEAMREVLGDAALFFDPTDSDQLAATLWRVAENLSLRADLVERGRARAREYSWTRSARALIELARDV